MTECEHFFRKDSLVCIKCAYVQPHDVADILRLEGGIRSLQEHIAREERDLTRAKFAAEIDAETNEFRKGMIRDIRKLTKCPEGSELVLHVASVMDRLRIAESK